MKSCPECKGLLGNDYGYKTIQNIYYITKEYVKHSFLFGFIKIYDTYKEKKVKHQEIKCCRDCATHNYRAKDYKAYFNYEKFKANCVRNDIKSFLKKMSSLRENE